MSLLENKLSEMLPLTPFYERKRRKHEQRVAEAEEEARVVAARAKREKQINDDLHKFQHLTTSSDFGGINHTAHLQQLLANKQVIMRMQQDVHDGIVRGITKYD